MNEWNIQARAHGCQACSQAFGHKQVYHTLLFDEKREFRRLDVCDACWQGQFSQGGSDRKGFVSYWQGTYEAPPPAPPEPIQKATAESLLRKLIELNDPKYSAAGYILAVMLERKRLLKVKEQFVREAQRVFIYEQPRSGDLFTIPDPNLQLNQLDQVQREVAELLERGLEPAAPPPPAANAGAAAVVEVPAELSSSEPPAEPSTSDPLRAEPLAH